MKEIIAWTVNVWRMYWGNGWIPYLLALGGACALIFWEKEKKQSQSGFIFRFSFWYCFSVRFPDG